MRRWVVLRADVRDLEFKAKSIKTICTDPPFGVGQKGTVIRREGGKFGKAKPIDTRIAPWDENPIHWTVYIPKFWEWLDDDGILILFHEKMTLLEIAKWWDEQGGQVRHIAVWIYNNATPQARKVKWRNCTNFILIATKNKGSGHAYHWEEGQGSDYFICPMIPGIHRHKNRLGQTHPTEKPVTLFSHWLLRWWGDRDGVILDPFCGTGSVLVAAYILGFKYIVGCDIDESWLEVARNRLIYCSKHQPRLI